MQETTVVVIGVLANILLGASYVPQVFKLNREKSADGISTSFWLILDASLLMLLILAIDSGQERLIMSQTLNLGLALIVTAQVIYYKRRGKRAKTINNQ